MQHWFSSSKIVIAKIEALTMLYFSNNQLKIYLFTYLFIYLFIYSFS